MRYYFGPINLCKCGIILVGDDGQGGLDSALGENDDGNDAIPSTLLCN